MFANKLGVILGSLTSLIKLLLVGYKVPYAEDMKNVEPSSENLSQLFSQIYLVNSFQIILNFTSCCGLWGFQDAEILSLYTEPEKALIDKSKRVLFRLGFLNIIKGKLEFLLTYVLTW